jgi:hypothetical protein
LAARSGDGGFQRARGAAKSDGDIRHGIHLKLAAAWWKTGLVMRRRLGHIQPAAGAAFVGRIVLYGKTVYIAKLSLWRGLAAFCRRQVMATGGQVMANGCRQIKY